MSNKNIEEIAELLDSGMTCFYHHPTGIIEYHPDLTDPYFDPESWAGVIDKIKSDRVNYKLFEKMDSHEGYRLMEEFTNTLGDNDFRNRILIGLSRKNPFRNFKNLIDRSDYRQDWFDFKSKAYKDYVKRLMEINN